MIYRHKIEFAGDGDTATYYGSAFTELSDNATLLHLHCWHVRSRCADSATLAVKRVTLQCKQDGRVWRAMQ